MPPRWDWVVTELTGTQTRLESPRSRKLTLTLDDSSSASFTLDGRDPQAIETNIIELQTDLTIYRDGLAIFRGRLGNSDDSGDADKHTVNFAAVDYRGLLDRRITYENLTFTNQQVGDIAWAMVSPDPGGTQYGPGGSLGPGVTRGANGTDPGQTATYTVAAGTKISEAIQTFSRSMWPGFSWWITPDLKFNTGARGGDRDLALVYGTTATAFKRQLDSSNYANAIRVSGSSDDQNVPAPSAIRFADDIATRPEGRFGVQVGLTDLKTQELVDGAVERELDNRATINPAWTFTLVPDLYDPAEIGVGDRLRFIVRSGRLNVDAYETCKQLEISLDDDGNETVDVTLGSLRADLISLFKTAPDRLERLERR